MFQQTNNNSNHHNKKQIIKIWEKKIRQTTKFNIKAIIHPCNVCSSEAFTSVAVADCQLSTNCTCVLMQKDQTEKIL